MLPSLPVSDILLVLQAHLINPAYYQDATEERALSRFCGYPICPNRIEKVVKQKYSIDLRAKKVYDVTFRKARPFSSSFLHRSI